MNITFTVFRVIIIRVYNFKNILKYNQQVIIFTKQKQYECNGTDFQYIQKISKIIPKTENREYTWPQSQSHKNNNRPHSRNDRNTVGYLFQGIGIIYPDNHRKLFSNFWLFISRDWNNISMIIQISPVLEMARRPTRTKDT